MSRDTKPIAPEVEHLLAAVKAVKRGLIPEKATYPLPDEEEQLADVEEENKETRT